MADGGGWSFRGARLNDVPAIVRAFSAARAEMTYLPELHSAEEHVSFFSDVVGEAGWFEVAGTRDVSLVGFCVVQHGRLEHLYVEPASQGCGLGSSLLEHAKVGHPGGLSLWVFAQNVRAQALYAGAGFVEVERTDGSGNEERVADVRMCWDGPSPH